MKRMQHPEHGFHDAPTTKEADEMRKNGWVDFVKPAPVEAEAEPEADAEPEATRRKPGRPPKG